MEAPFLRVLSPCAAREASFLKLAARPQPCGGGSKPPEKASKFPKKLARERAARCRPATAAASVAADEVEGAWMMEEALTDA